MSLSLTCITNYKFVRLPIGSIVEMELI